MDEASLIRAAQQGDQSAFARLVEANQGRIYSLCYRMTGNSEDAADLTQEAFLNAWRGLGSFGGQAAFSTWLYRLASNACIDFLRREKRRMALSMTQEEDEEGRQTDLLQAAVQEGLSTLSPEHRQVLLLRETEGLSYQEIAQCLSLEEGTVKSRIARARLALKEFLVKNGNFSFPPPSK